MWFAVDYQVKVHSKYSTAESSQCPTVCVCSLLSHPSGSKRTHKQLINTLVLFFSLLSLRLWCVFAMSCWDALDPLLNFCGPVVEVHLHQHQLQPTQYKWKKVVYLNCITVIRKSENYVQNTWDQSIHSDTCSVRFSCHTEIHVHIHTSERSQGRSGSYCSLDINTHTQSSIKHIWWIINDEVSEEIKTHRCHTWPQFFQRDRYTCRSLGHMIRRQHSHMTESSSDRTCPARKLRT